MKRRILIIALLRLCVVLFLFLSFMSFLISSCSDINENTKGVILFDRDESLTVFDIGTITDDTTVQIIPLETTENNLISKIDKIEIRNNRIYVKDNLSRSIYIFEMTGKYAGKINAVGQGPGEYILPSYMTVTDTSIIVVDNPTGKQIEYNLLSLQPINEKRIFDKIWCSEDIFTLPGKIYYINGWSETSLGKYRLFSSDGDRYNAYLPFKKQIPGLSIHGPVYTVNANHASVIFAQSDIIYTVRDDSIKPEYKVEFRNKRVEYSDGVASVFDNPSGRVIGIDAIHESDNYLFIDVSYTVDVDAPLENGNYDTYTCLLHKSNNKKCIYPNSKVFNSKFDNEQIIIRKIIDNKIITWRESTTLITQRDYLYKDKVFKNKAFETRLNEVLSVLTEDDNPVLFIYNLN